MRTLKKKQKNTLLGFTAIGLTVALILDIYYKGLIYQLFKPKKVQS